MSSNNILRLAKGVGGILASIAAEKVIEKIGRKIIAKRCK